MSAARGPSFDRRHGVVEPAHAGTGAGAGRAATFVVATAIGCLAAVAVVHWIELEGLTGVAAAAMLPVIGVPSRRSWLHRVALRARLAWARYNLQALQVDIECMEGDLVALPAHIAYLKRHAAARRARIARLEGALQ